MESIRFAESLAVFVDVAQDRSFSAAARRRGVAASSVARQIDALEQNLKVPLFTRSTRALVMTEAGTLLHERAREDPQRLDRRAQRGGVARRQRAGPAAGELRAGIRAAPCHAASRLAVREASGAERRTRTHRARRRPGARALRPRDPHRRPARQQPGLPAHRQPALHHGRLAGLPAPPRPADPVRGAGAAPADRPPAQHQRARLARDWPASTGRGRRSSRSKATTATPAACAPRRAWASR